MKVENQTNEEKPNKKGKSGEKIRSLSKKKKKKTTCTGPTPIAEQDQNLSKKQTFQPLDYVIIEYEETPFPGQILSITDGRFRVSCMEKAKAGNKGWVWPDAMDLEYYDSILKRIAEPRPLSTRGTGTFSVPELNKSRWGP